MATGAHASTASPHPASVPARRTAELIVTSSQVTPGSAFAPIESAPRCVIASAPDVARGARRPGIVGAAVEAEMRRIRMLLLGGAFAVLSAVAPGASAGTSPFGPNVHVFTPSMPVSQIQAAVDAVAHRQLANEFGSERDALLFEPGTYGSAGEPLNFQVGFYTEVAGLGASPGDVVINGSIDVYNQCDGVGTCTALHNFWRSLSNLTINVTNSASGCYAGEFWAAGKGAPLRRVDVNGLTTLMDYCTGPSFASGGYIADSVFENGTVINGSQQQFLVRNSKLDSWTNGVWNQVFVGDTGAPAECFPAQSACGGAYTTLATSPVIAERPFLTARASGAFGVVVPSFRRRSAGPSWGAPTGTPGTSIAISRFFIARPSTRVSAINRALARGRNLLLTPGVYRLNHPIEVVRRDTVVLGLGFPTLVPQAGIVALRVANVRGVRLAGLIVDAGPKGSPALVQVGRCRARLGDRQADVSPTCRAGRASAVPSAAHGSSASDPTVLQDVFFRVGGATAGRAKVSLVVNSSNVILDDVWAWRADHGSGVGWTRNTADSGLVVNGKHVTAYGLFVDHFQRNEVIWNGQGGTVIFLENEMPFDPPNQAAWRSSATADGYPAVLVSPVVTSFEGYGLGSYSDFNRGVDIFAAMAFRVPAKTGVRLHDLLTIFLDAGTGKGGIVHVVNGTGGSATAANPSMPVTVVDYP
jgi:hypothetical protein